MSKEPKYKVPFDDKAVLDFFYKLSVIPTHSKKIKVKCLCAEQALPKNQKLT